jgi:hypothetical protein
VVFVFIQLGRKRFIKLNLSFLVLSSVVGGWVVLGVVIAMSRTGGDVYGGQRSISGFMQALEGNPKTLLLLGLALVVWVIDWGLSHTSGKVGGSNGRGLINGLRARSVSLTALSIVLIYLGEIFFYQHALNNSQFMARYGMISELAVVFMYLAIVFLGLRALSLFNGFSITSTWKLLPVAIALTVVYSSLGAIEGHARSYPVISEASVVTTAQQMTIIEAMSDTLNESPDMQVYIFADKPFDYELVYSLPLFLEYYAARDVEFYLQTQIPEELRPDGYFDGLASTLDDISQQGGWSIEPIASFDPERQTLCIYFGEAVSFDFCTATMGSW